MKAKLFLIFFMLIALVGCVKTTTETPTTEHEWIGLTGTYYITYFDGLPINKVESYLKLIIDSEGNFSGLLKIAAADGSFVDSDGIDTWSYNADTKELYINYHDSYAAITYIVVEYGSVIKFDKDDFVMLMEK